VSGENFSQSIEHLATQMLPAAGWGRIELDFARDTLPKNPVRNDFKQFF